MKNYNEMSCGELRRELNQINNDLKNIYTMTPFERDHLTYKRMKINGALLRKVAAMLDECDEEA